MKNPSMACKMACKIRKWTYEKMPIASERLWRIWTDKRGGVMAAVLAVLFVLQILPVLYLGRYNHPTSDDFLYGDASHAAFARTGSVLSAITAAVCGVLEDYEKWQGSFSALFLFRLQPGIFGESWYSIVPYLMIGILTGGTLYFLWALLRMATGEKSWHSVSAALVICSLLICCSPLPSEQFFWYNSAVYYNFFHSLLLFYLGLVVRYLSTGKRRHVIVMALLGVFLGGGNYVTALTLGILLATLAAILLCKKKKEGVILGGLWLLFMASFILSAMAPGNAVRAQSVTGMSAVSSVLHSLWQGVECYAAWTDKWWLFGMVLLLPLELYAIRKSTCSFGHPILFVLYLYGVFSAMFCPTFYALGTTGPGRIINIIYDGFYLITAAQLFYVLGFAVRCCEAKKMAEEADLWWKKSLKVSWLVLLVLLLAGMAGSSDLMDKTPAVACRTILKGDAARYHAEYMTRLSVLEDDSVEDVEFEPYTVAPALVFIADATDDPEFPNNAEWAAYYGKRSLLVHTEDSVPDEAE